MNGNTKIAALLATLFGLASAANAGKIAVTAAADLKFCLDSLIQEYSKTHPTDEIQVTYGSSGKAFAQIQQGAPFDVFLSADVEYPNKLFEAGLAASKPRLYALGRIVLWSATEDASKLDLRSLASPKFAKVAIANPLHAPYGKRAEEALRKLGIWDGLQPKLVLGENIAQTAQFAQSGSASIGVLALSLVKSPAFAGKGYSLIPANLHSPLEQAVVVLKRAEKNPLATDFVNSLFAPSARKVFEQYGFSLPAE